MVLGITFSSSVTSEVFLLQGAEIGSNHLPFCTRFLLTQICGDTSPTHFPPTTWPYPTAVDLGCRACHSPLLIYFCFYFTFLLLTPISQLEAPLASITLLTLPKCQSPSGTPWPRCPLDCRFSRAQSDAVLCAVLRLWQFAYSQ